MLKLKQEYIKKEKDKETNLKNTGLSQDQIVDEKKLKQYKYYNRWFWIGLIWTVSGLIDIATRSYIYESYNISDFGIISFIFALVSAPIGMAISIILSFTLIGIIILITSYRVRGKIKEELGL